MKILNYKIKLSCTCYFSLTSLYNNYFNNFCQFWRTNFIFNRFDTNCFLVGSNNTTYTVLIYYYLFKKKQKHKHTQTENQEEGEGKFNTFYLCNHDLKCTQTCNHNQYQILLEYLPTF